MVQLRACRSAILIAISATALYYISQSAAQMGALDVKVPAFDVVSVKVLVIDHIENPSEN
jgi:hypothetical protein